MPGTAKHDLRKVKELAKRWKNGDEDCGVFTAQSRSIHYVARILKVDTDCAKDIVLDGIMKLQERDFCRRVILWDCPDEIGDEYGLKGYEGHNWYIKFSLSDDLLEEISFHPVEKILKLANGEILEVTMSENELSE